MGLNTVVPATILGPCGRDMLPLRVVRVKKSRISVIQFHAGSGGFRFWTKMPQRA
jgi:hypothetical protein